jgi:hypothetical protein
LVLGKMLLFILILKLTVALIFQTQNLRIYFFSHGTVVQKCVNSHLFFAQRLLLLKISLTIIILAIINRIEMMLAKSCIISIRLLNISIEIRKLVLYELIFLTVILEVEPILIGKAILKIVAIVAVLVEGDEPGKSVLLSF